MDNQKVCQNCAYRRAIPGNAHLRCAYAWHRSEHSMPAGDPHGIRMGWYHFPFNFDPRWMLGQCPAWSEAEDPDMVFGDDHPLIQLLSLWG